MDTHPQQLGQKKTRFYVEKRIRGPCPVPLDYTSLPETVGLLESFTTPQTAVHGGEVVVEMDKKKLILQRYEAIVHMIGTGIKGKKVYQ